jgi:hypothetical protein
MDSGKITAEHVEVIMLGTLQVVLTMALWVLNPISQPETDTFALLLSADMLAFVLVSYLYRARRYGRVPGSFWLACGYFALMVLLVSNLAFR